LKKYSKGGLNKQYPIIVTVNNKEIGKVWVDFIEPRLEYLVVSLDGDKKMCYTTDEVIETCYNDRIEIVDVKTNVADNYRVKVNFKGFSGSDSGDDMGKSILLNNKLLRSYSIDKKGHKYEIVVSRGKILLGKVVVHIGKRE
jgi:hypothetical protein